MEYSEKLVRFVYDFFIPFGMMFSFVIGSCIGSFLNVCIWRIPRGENLSYPGSHCPKCNYEIPAYENIPILAWLMLAGKCKSCRAPISARYILIEAFTGLVFVGVTYKAKLMHLPIETLLPLYFLAAAFITIIFIDIKHLIIPNKITWTGIGTALTFALVLPHSIILPTEHILTGLSMDQQWLVSKLPALQDSPRLLALTYSLTGFLIGYGILWSTVELGKILFGKQKFKFQEPINIEITSQGAQAEGDELFPWQEMFDRETDELLIHVESGNWQIKENEGELGESILRIKHSGLTVNDQHYQLEEIKNIHITSKYFIVPREAMGRGDIKMLGMVGAFLGPAGALFTLMLATFSGCFIGLTAILFGKMGKGKQIPFGPYLAIGATAWMLFWPEFTEYYHVFIDKLGHFLGASQ